MKKYEKPAIEIVEVDLSKNYLQNTSTGMGGTPEFAPGKKGAPEDEDDNGFSEGW